MSPVASHRLPAFNSEHPRGNTESHPRVAFNATIARCEGRLCGAHSDGEHAPAFQLPAELGSTLRGCGLACRRRSPGSHRCWVARQGQTR
jgi:hypothetical protein